MKFRPLFSLLAATLAVSAQAQNAAAPAKADESAVREALKKQESDPEQSAEILKTTLTSVDKRYSMIKRGNFQFSYDLSYTYIGQDKISTDLSSGNATIFNIENDNSHTVTNTLSFDYGLRDNLTANVSIPFVSKYAQTSLVDGVTHSVGDISIGVRYQPFETMPDVPSLTVSGSVRIPTGTSPYKVISGSGLATGSGTTGFTAGLNISKVVDPVALFGSMNVSYSRPSDDLSQVLGSAFLTRVDPGLSMGFGFGFAYAFSYSITTSFSFQESISRGSRMTFSNGSTATTATQTSATLSYGVGYRISPKTTVNTSVGFGLTPNSPNLTLGLNFPLSL